LAFLAPWRLISARLPALPSPLQELAPFALCLAPSAGLFRCAERAEGTPAYIGALDAGGRRL